ncbi:hypothetical protein HDU99_002900, partial [Rhizoclosmatium hyalinum]
MAEREGNSDVELGLIHNSANSVSPTEVYVKSESETTKKPTTPRLTSLDAFRGFTIISMIMANFQQEGAFEILTHASWTERISFVDFIFPTFVFMMGM